MKRLLSISFAILFFLAALFPFSDVEEVFRLPALIKHYQEHKERAVGQDFNFLDFLTMHYLDTDHSTSEEHNLPLYEHECSALVFIMPSMSNYVMQPSAQINIKYNHHLYLNYFYQYIGFLLQPPRLV